MDLTGAYADEMGISRREAAVELEGMIAYSGVPDELDESRYERELDELCEPINERGEHDSWDALRAQYTNGR